MASILTRTQTGIVFDNIDNTTGTLQMPLKITQSAESLDYKLIDAVNIDWNNAYLPNTSTYINTTGDLLAFVDKTIQDINTQIGWETYDETLDSAWQEYNETTEAPTTTVSPTTEEPEEDDDEPTDTTTIVE